MTRAPQPGRLRVYLEPRDAWIGCYVANDACPLPFVVIRWTESGGHLFVKESDGVFVCQVCGEVPTWTGP